MELLLLWSFLLLQFQGIIGMTITNTLSNSRPLLGETIMLSCNIKGGTASIVFWWKDKYKNPGAINMSYNCFVLPKEYESRLRNFQCDMNNYNFQLSNVQISDGGDWVCEADGKLATNTLRLNILVPPNVQIRTSKTTVTEHEFVRFECATSGGNPEHIEQYQWLWNKDNATTAQIIHQQQHRDSISNSIENGKFLEFARIPYDKSGIYTCKAWNLGGMGQASTALNVQYSPRISPAVKMKYDIASLMGKEATFELFIIANPTPATAGYVWSKDGNVLSRSSPEYEIISGSTFSKLTVKKVKASNYQNYTCSVKTSVFQEKIFKFMLLKEDPPSAPSKLEVVNLTAVAATLKWISEFNGGYEQRFFVQYKKSTQNWPVSEVPQGGIDDPGLKKVVYHKVKDLESNASYQFRVRSKNSHPGRHTSDFSNTAVGETPKKPQTALIGVTRAHDTVTVRWKQVTGNYTALKIVYCQTGTEDCRNHTVAINPKDNAAAFILDADKTYYYYLILEDGSDVVYKSTECEEEVDEKTDTGFAVVGGVVGAGVVATTVVIAAVVLWKRGLVQWGKKQSHQPANDSVDYDDTRAELATAGKGSAHTYYNIGTGHKPTLPMVMGHQHAERVVLGNEPAYPNDDIDAYDYPDSPSLWQPSVSGENPAPEPQENQTDCAAANEQSGQDVSSGKKGEQERQELEGMDINVKILILQERPDQSKAERDTSQANGQTASLPDDDMAHDHAYTHLGPVEPIKQGEYLDLRQLSSE